MTDAPRLCVTVTATTMDELRRRRDAASSADGVDLVELRLDGVVDPNVAGALGGRRKPVIVTCRPQWEGGRFDGAEEDRQRLLAEAIAGGAEYVDIEWRARLEPLIKTAGSRAVVSMHDFERVPDSLERAVRAMWATGAGHVKAAVQVRSLADSVRLLGAARQHPGTIVIGMGERGLVTRVLAARFRSPWTYAGDLGDVGQVTASTLVDDFGFHTLSSSAAVYGLVGSPIGHSVSPAMHNAALRASRRDAVYLPLPAADVDDFIAFAHGFDLQGASITIPFKVSLFTHVDEAYAVARRIGAINTIKNESGRWLGGNTDAAGFVGPLQRVLDRQPIARGPMRASLVGAGGAARAAAVALASIGADVTVHARRRAQAAEVAQLVGGRAGTWPPPAGSWDVLVNCTPIGMYPGEEASPMAGVPLDGGIVYDLIYNPPATRLLRDAAAAGCVTIGGLEMLVAQAEEQFAWWFGSRPAAGVMREAAERRLASFATAVEGAFE